MADDLLIRRAASMSPCARYRYRLSRHWDDRLPEATFIMLNPSAADGLTDDATIRKCMGFARRWNLGGLYVGNLFAVRATKPADMMAATDPVGVENRDHLEWICERASANGGITVCAWGANGSYMDQDETFLDWMPRRGVVPMCLRVTRRSGAPEHPLYVPYDTRPHRYAGRAMVAA